MAGDDIAAFLAELRHVADALTRMEAAMTVATTALKDDPNMRAELDEISAEVLSAAFKTDFGREYVARKRAAEREAIYRKLLGVMSEEQARKITGYAGK